MKKIIFPLLFLCCFAASAQSDSCAGNALNDTVHIRIKYATWLLISANTLGDDTRGFRAALKAKTTANTDTATIVMLPIRVKTALSLLYQCINRQYIESVRASTSIATALRNKGNSNQCIQSRMNAYDAAYERRNALNIMSEKDKIDDSRTEENY